jgi:hypothetical protein
MDIYSILASKPHNPHYLNRYITFVQQCQHKNIQQEGYFEKHHICPKAKDMFPEYKSFSKNPWNKVLLTPRQHFIAHLILWKIFPGFYSQLISLNLMKKNSEIKNSKIYQEIRSNYRIMMSIKCNDPNFHLKGKNNPCHKKIKNGTHVFLSETLRTTNSERMKKKNPMTKIKTNRGSFKKGNKPIITEERNLKISLSKIGDKNPNYGKKGCFDHLNHKKIECPHCGIITTPGNAKRWHFENCKHSCMEK